MGLEDKIMKRFASFGDQVYEEKAMALRKSGDAGVPPARASPMEAGRNGPSTIPSWHVLPEGLRGATEIASLPGMWERVERFYG